MPDGTTNREQFDDPDNAHEYFLACKEKLRAAVENRGNDETSPLPEMPGPPADALKRAEMLTSLFEALQLVLAPLAEGLPANGETKITLARVVHGDAIQIVYRPGAE